MKFQSKQQVLMGEHFEEHEMFKFASQLIYDTEMDIDQVAIHFVEQFGESNRHIIEAILEEVEL